MESQESFEVSEPEGPLSSSYVTKGDIDISSVVNDFLTLDFLERRDRKWELIDTDAKWSEFFTQRISRLRDNDNPTSDGRFVIGSFNINYRTSGRRSPVLSLNWEEIKNATLERLDGHFIHLNELLKFFEGKLVAAGGALFRAMGSAGASDVDLFFVDPDVGNEMMSASEKMDKYNKMLVLAIEFLTARHLGDPDLENPTSYVTRNANVTTVYLDAIREQIQKYQFIHRVYPTYDSVIGGFDLGTSMMLYDGHNLMANTLGAFSCLTKTLIVDLSRRSTSMESRIEKYGLLGAKVVFPGLSDNVFRERFLTKQLTIEGGELVFEDILKMYREDADLIGIDDKIKEYALSHGYGIDMEAFVNDFDNDVFDTPRYSSEEYMSKIPIAVKIPNFNFRFSFDNLAVPVWFAMLNKNPGIIYEVSDYGGNGYVKPVVVSTMPNRSLRRGESDYGDSNEFQKNITPYVNLKMLYGNKIENVVAILVFKRPGGSVRCVDGARILEECFKLVQPYVHTFKKNGDVDFQKNIGVISKFLFSADISNPEDLLSTEIERGMRHDGIYSLRFIQSAIEKNSKVYQQILHNAQQASEILKMGPRWILENPGRQWTSSINPIVADVREWYGPDNYNGFKIGYEPIETCLRLARLRHPGFGRLPKDIFNIILRLVIRETALSGIDAWRNEPYDFEKKFGNFDKVLRTIRRKHPEIPREKFLYSSNKHNRKFLPKIPTPSHIVNVQPPSALFLGIPPEIIPPPLGGVPGIPQFPSQMPMPQVPHPVLPQAPPGYKFLQVPNIPYPLLVPDLGLPQFPVISFPQQQPLQQEDSDDEDSMTEEESYE